MNVKMVVVGAANHASASRKPLAYGQVVGNEIHLNSPLLPDNSLNDHLVWLWGVLQHERRFLKSLQAEGATITVFASGVRGSIEIRPNGAEMLHLIGANLVIRPK